MHLHGQRATSNGAPQLEPAAFVAFDILRDGGRRSLRRCRWSSGGVGWRRARRRRWGVPAGGAGARETDGAAWTEARAPGWEGLVVKDARSPYRPGRALARMAQAEAGPARQEFVVGGFTEPRGVAGWLRGVAAGGPDGGRASALRRPRGRRIFGQGARAGPRDCSRSARRRAAPFETASAGQRAAALGASGAGRGGAVFVLDQRRASARSRSIWACATTGRQPKFGSRSRLRHTIQACGSRRPTKGKQPTGRPTAADPELARMLGDLEALGERGGGRLVLPDGAALQLGNLGKPLWPKLGLTKADLFRYYLEVSPYLLPVVRDRPLVMKRMPTASTGPSFFQHRARGRVPARRARGEHPGRRRPEPVRGRVVWPPCSTWPSSRSSRRTPGSRARQSPLRNGLRRHRPGPDGRGAVLPRARRGALGARRARALGVTGHLKTSGASGLHIYLPMRPGTPFEAGMLFCRIIARVVAAPAPRGGHRGARRVSKRDVRSVYVDCLQNVDGKTLACAYSARASDFAGASTPLAWDELDDRARSARFHDPHAAGAAARGRRSLGGPARVARDRPGGRARPCRLRRHGKSV